MIFGQPTDFAIEAFHEPSSSKYGGFGRLCVHIKNARVGNIRDNHCSLFHATDRFRELASSIETLWDKSFADLSDSEIFGLIDQRSSWEPFGFLTNTGEMFDGYKTFIVCCPNGQVHVLCRFPDNTFGAGSCSVQSFRTVANAFVLWFDEQVRNTAPPFFPINPFDLNESASNNQSRQ